ncbi:acyl-CoA dehydrogenase [Planomonospora parontospora subsp. parontospora]|uniref:Acyl-CoA dehydrogenase n=2 Tax=Planomonospora parontospora TaxID=58119 RepID=A0AA37BCB1_9ACTN|nr:acyl-CoA dehydrogenase family protein [Planomonospora parontospora]GGK49941.1 acyl-CoA dehydrogenase [Planomonospora parontospora]GII07173.1 acyl-CoA dehydrogenase [Planomonospora parontospora subsp. parontospora]
MDFTLDEAQEELRGLAAGLLGREAAPARLDAHERSGEPYDAGLWRALARAGLLGAVLPEEAGGAGLGPVELAVILREVGAHVAPVPVQQSLVAAMTVAGYGSAAQRRALAPLAEGGLVLSAAPRGPARPRGARGVPGTAGTAPGTMGTASGTAGTADGPGAVTARRTPGGGWVLDGRTGAVPYAAQADRVLVPAALDGGAGLFMVGPGAAELRAVPLPSGEPGAVLVLDGAPAEPVGPDGGGGGEALRGLRRLATAGAVATASGVLAGALALTTGYIGTRRQFGRALAEFQAVTVQIADVYIAGRALDVALWSAVWRLAEGPPEEAEADLAVGAFTAAGAGLKALYTCQHLHGGIGLDVTYPLHRHFAWARHQAHLLGGAEARLDEIGALAG